MTQMQIDNLSTEEYSYFLAHGEVEQFMSEDDAELMRLLTEFDEVTNLEYANQ